MTSADTAATAGLSIISTFVLSGMEPLRLVIRYGDGTWSFLCNTTADAQYLVSVHTAEVFARFENDLRTLRDLPPGFLAERDGYGHEWQLERDSEHY